MASKKILLLAAFATLVCSSEVDEVEQKKRGAGKTTLNAIPTGGQKTDYTYSIYSQNPSQPTNTYQQSASYQSQPSSSYQSQVPSSFYPSQPGSSQYYQPASQTQESPSIYPPQPQINLIPPPSSSQFLPLNFVPNPGYQAKYQIIQPKSQNGNIQFAVIPSQSFLQGQSFVYPQSLFGNAPSPTHQNTILSPVSPQGPFAQNYQLPFGQPSAMFIIPQPNPSIYSNLLYPNSGPSLSAYYQPQTNPQAKYSLYYGGASPNNQSPPPNDYDKSQGAVPQNAPKEDNEISVHNSDYITPAETNASYKNAYVSNRSGYKN